MDQIAASGTCADYIDRQVTAKGRGVDREVDALLAQMSDRNEVKAMCKKARGKPA
jgi:hypothetical protein